MRSTTARGFKDNCKTLNFHLRNSVIHSVRPLLHCSIYKKCIINMKKKCFIYLQLQEYAPYTRNAQEVLGFHEQKHCQKCSKYYYSCIKISTFGFYFPYWIQSIKLFSLNLYLRATYLLSNFWHLTNENENVYFQFHYKVAKELINSN